MTTQSAPFVNTDRDSIDPLNPPAIYHWTGPTGVQFTDIRHLSGTYYRQHTPRAIIDALETARATGSTVRIFPGDTETGKSWNEENDVCGKVGRSTGWLKTALLMDPRSNYGGAVSGDNIVALQLGGVFVYRHPSFVLPSIEVKAENVYSDSPFAAYIDGSKEVHARFKTLKAAQRWAAFMRGERQGK